MKFNESLLFQIVSACAGVYLQNSVYHSILATPMVLIVLIIGIPIALIVDFVVAMTRVKA